MRRNWGTGAVLVLALALTACGGPSKNATACKLFEDSYNKLGDAVAAKLSRDTVVAERDMLPSRIRDAEDKAEGDVAVALRDARELAPALKGDNEDAGTAFFMATTTVAEKCKADGAAIDLHKFR